ncbi:MAG: chemotaxis protein CheA [Bacteroidales bacterium]|jgi:two-component system chemotaxis sensor kinase CheA|nr:chemotaxis protein CheA [Bacteroidales bacterium]
MIEELTEKFKSEALDYITTIESNLMKLEKDSSDKELVREVFRFIHNLKGNSAMFGFTNIDRLSHVLETLFDKIREDKIEITSELISSVLNSMDHLRVLLDKDDHCDEHDLTIHEELIKTITAMSSGTDTNTPKTKPTYANTPKYKSYYIYLESLPDLLKNGTNPIFLIEEIADMGENWIHPITSKVPEWNTINPEQSYIAWEILVYTDKNKTEIEEVFMFVETEINIEIVNITDDNIFENQSVQNLIINSINSENKLGLENIEKHLISKKPESKTIETNTASGSKIIKSVRVTSEKLDHLMNLVSEQVVLQARLLSNAEEKKDPELFYISENINKITRQLRDVAFSLILIPVKSLFSRFQRMVRDISVELEKDINLEVIDNDTELDKFIIEGLSDPLLHIVRNSLDHGIESKSERIEIGKNPTGKLTLKSYYSGAHVVIEVSDDGRGIDPDKVKTKAVEKGLISANETLTEKQVMELLFTPGFSTSDSVTELSGRGVGMDIVYKRISDLRGDIVINSQKGIGTTIKLKLPVTLSIIDGLLVQVKDESYIIPLFSVYKIYPVTYSQYSESFHGTIKIDNERLPYYDIIKEFYDDYTPENDKAQVIIVENEDDKFGLIVENIIGEYQAVLKPLGYVYENKDFFSGASILGNGSIALVLDVSKLIRKIQAHQKTKQLNLNTT